MNVVSLLSHQKELVLGVKVMENEKKSEMVTVHEWNSVGCVIKVEQQGTSGGQPYHRIGYKVSK